MTYRQILACRFACLFVTLTFLQGCGTQSDSSPHYPSPSMLLMTLTVPPDSFTPVQMQYFLSIPLGTTKAPTGKVNFSCVSDTGVSCFQGTGALPSGIYDGPILPRGNYTITASYPGDSNFVSAQVSQNVRITKPFFVTSNTTVALCPGCSVNLPVTAVSISSYSGNVDLAIDGLPSGVTYAPTSIPLGTTTPVTLTAATDADSEDFNSQTSLDAIDKPLTITTSLANDFPTTTHATLHMQIEDTTFTPAQTYLPVLKVATNTGDAITSKDDYVAGSVTLSDPSNSANNYSGTMTIKGHGNSTWGMPKKPYNLKLDSKAGLLGMPKSKKWVLLANYSDKSMLRNAVAQELGNRVGMAWSPRSKFVEVFVNDTYQGVYQLIEKIDIDSNRVNIDELDDTVTSGNKLTGGYLMEIDNWRGDDFNFTTTAGLPIGSEDPDPPNSQQQNYIINEVNAAESALYSPSFTDSTAGWPAHFDQDSLVKWYLVQEMVENQDGDFWSSDYFYKKRNDPHFYMGPLWDFDISMGNVNYSQAVDPSVLWIASEASWYKQLFQDPQFLTATQTQYTDYRNQIADVQNFIDTQAAALKGAMGNNYMRWRTLNEGVWPNSEVAGSFDGEIAYLKSWLASRVTTMDSYYYRPNP